jgi:hypothetical protein
LALVLIQRARRSRAAALQTKISDAEGSRNGADAARVPDNIPSSLSISRFSAVLRVTKRTTEHQNSVHQPRIASF